MKYKVGEYVRVNSQSSVCDGLVGMVIDLIPQSTDNWYRVCFDQKVTAKTKIEGMRLWYFMEKELEEFPNV